MTVLPINLDDIAALQLRVKELTAEVDALRNKLLVADAREERFRQAIDLSATAYCHHDRELRYTWIHHPHMGFSPEDVLGKTDWDILERDLADRMGAIKRQVLDTGIGVRVEMPTRLNDSDAEVFDLIVEPLRDGAGSVVGLSCAGVNITELKRSEMARKRSEELLREVQAVAHLGYYVFEIGEDRWESSDILDRLFGIDADYPRDAAHWLALVDPEMRVEMAEYLASVLASGHQFDREYLIRRNDDGDQRWVAGLGSIERDATGRPVRMVGTIHDITERKAIERQLRSALAAAEESNRAKTLFLAMMSHELRTPLNGIIGSLSAVEGLPEAAPLCKTHAMVMDSANTLLTIIRDILDFSLMERGEFHITEIDFDPYDVVSTVDALHRQRALDKGIAYTVRVTPDVPRCLRGDGIRLGQIITNLLGNAVKFTELGHVELAIAASPERDGVTTLTISVEDTGIGIAAERLGGLFEPFTQGDPSILRRFGGTGLGLAISHRLAQLMGGTVTAESEPGCGSHFKAVIPFKIGAELAAADIVAAPPPNLSPQPLAILVAEDDPTSRAVAEKIVTRLGHAVTSVADGEAAVSAVKTAGYNLVLMDVQMPVMDGLAATRAIRALSDPICAIPIIGLTANAFAEDVQGCYDAGMTGYVSKPFTVAALGAAIGRVLENVRMQREG